MSFRSGRHSFDKHLGCGSSREALTPLLKAGGELLSLAINAMSCSCRPMSPGCGRRAAAEALFATLQASRRICRIGVLSVYASWCQRLFELGGGGASFLEPLVGGVGA